MSIQHTFLGVLQPRCQILPGSGPGSVHSLCPRGPSWKPVVTVQRGRQGARSGRRGHKLGGVVWASLGGRGCCQRGVRGVQGEAAWEGGALNALQMEGSHAGAAHIWVCYKEECLRVRLSPSVVHSGFN